MCHGDVSSRSTVPTGQYDLKNGMQGTLSNLELQNVGGQRILRGDWSLNGVTGNNHLEDGRHAGSL